MVAYNYTSEIRNVFISMFTTVISFILGWVIHSETLISISTARPNRINGKPASLSRAAEQF